MKKNFIAPVILAVCALAFSAPAFADPPQGKPDKGDKTHKEQNNHGDGAASEHYSTHDAHGEQMGDHHDHGDGHNFAVDVSVILGRDQRDVIHDYFREHDHHDCPPGLAKKHNGCLPPGIAKKRYEVGGPIPHDVVIGDLPDVLRSRLPHLPDGYGYRQLDGDVALIELSTGLIIDAVGRFD